MSDKHLMEKYGLLKNLNPGDVLLADRGFDIHTSVGFYCAERNIPTCTRGKAQLSAIEIETTRSIAAVRIHVERVIGLIRQKYTMLQSTVPITLLNKNE